MAISTPNKELDALQRRFKRGYRLERSGSSYYHVFNGDEDGPVRSAEGKIIRIASTPASTGYSKTISELEAIGALEPLDRKAAKSRPRGPGTISDGTTARKLSAERDRKRQQESDELHDRLDKALKPVGGLHQPGMQADLTLVAAQVAREGGEDADPDLLEKSISRVALKHWVVPKYSGLFEQVAETLEQAESVNELFFALLRRAKGLPEAGSEIGEQLSIPQGEWPFRVELLPVSSLFVDHAYQRPVPWPFVRKMATEFDPTLVGTIDVSERRKGDLFAILDGQCRWETIRKLGKERIWCSVYSGLSVADEARFFLKKNRNRKAVLAYYVFRAKVTSGDEKAIELEANVSRRGFKLAPTSATGKDERFISAIAALEDAQRLEVLDAVLVTLVPMRGREQGLAAPIIRGLTRFYWTFPDANVQRMSEVLEGRGPVWFIGSAREQGSGGTGVQAAMFRLMVSAYNLGLPAGERLRHAS